MDSEKTKWIATKSAFTVFKKGKAVITIYRIWHTIEWKHRETWFWRWYTYNNTINVLGVRDDEMMWLP